MKLSPGENLKKRFKRISDIENKNDDDAQSLDE